MAVLDHPDPTLLPPYLNRYPWIAPFLNQQAYIHHDGAHYVADILPNLNNPMGTFTGGVGAYSAGGSGIWGAPGLTVTRVADDGTLTQYPVDCPYYWGWSGQDGAPVVDLCTFHQFTHRSSWSVGFDQNEFGQYVGDVQFASDGADLWMGVICRAERRYPWYHQKYPTGVGDITGYVADIPTFEAASAAAQYWFFEGSFLCSGSGAPWDDLGGATSQRFSPYHLVMFLWTGAGFTHIGEIDAAFVNNGDAPAKVSGVELAASPAEPGVCHAMWSEVGRWGQRDPGPGPWPNRGSRLSYSRWDTSGNTLDVNLLYYDQIFDLIPYPPPDRPSGPHYDPTHLVDGELPPYGPPMDDSNLCYTHVFTLKNDGGSPICFISRMTIVPGFDIFDLGPAEPAIRVWDLSSPVTNAPVEIQSLTPDLLPQPSETAYADYPSNFPNGLTITSLAPGSANNRSFIFGISPPYADPLLAGQEVYLLSVNFVGDPVDNPGFPASAQGVYRIPIDASGPFTVLDGDRQVAILPNATKIGTTIPIQDFFSEPRNVWIPSQEFGSKGVLKQLDRVCTNDWVNQELAPGFAEVFLFEVLARYPIFWDAAASTFYYAAIEEDNDTSVWKFVGRTRIVQGDCGAIGLHIWDRPAEHK